MSQYKQDCREWKATNPLNEVPTIWKAAFWKQKSKKFVEEFASRQTKTVYEYEISESKF